MTIVEATGAHDLPGLKRRPVRRRLTMSARGLLVSLAVGGSASVVGLMVISAAMSSSAIAPPVAWVAPATTVAAWPTTTSTSVSLATALPPTAVRTGSRIVAKPAAAAPVPITLATPPQALSVARAAPVAAASGKAPDKPLPTTDPPITSDPPVVVSPPAALFWTQADIDALNAHCADHEPGAHVQNISAGQARIPGLTPPCVSPPVPPLDGVEE